MPAELTLLDPESEEQIDLLTLGEILIPEDGLGDGQPICILCRNTGTTNLRKISISLEGPGKAQVQLARDEGGTAGAWAEAGESIIPVTETVYRGERFYFWARGVYRPEDAEDRLKFKLVFNATSTG